MSSEDWRTVILAIVALVPGLAAAYWARGANDKAKVAKDIGARNEKKIDAVAVTAHNTQRMGEATHTLVNSNMGAQLALTAQFSRRVADLTKRPEDDLIAIEAQRQLDEHKSRQAIVDSRPPPTATTTGLGTGTPADQASIESHASDQPVVTAIDSLTEAIKETGDDTNKRARDIQQRL